MKPLRVTISYMERPGDLALADSVLPQGFSIQRGVDDAALYRDLYYEVGEAYFWWERRLWSDAEWQALSDDSNTEIWVLYSGDDRAGYFELNFSDLPEAADLAFFGLYKPYIGKGVGKALLIEALRRLAERSPDFMRVNTCNLDHPAAFSLYEACGFRRNKQIEKIIEDPRGTGVLPSMSLPKHYKASLK